MRPNCCSRGVAAARRAFRVAIDSNSAAAHVVLSASYLYIYHYTYSVHAVANLLGIHGLAVAAEGNVSIEMPFARLCQPCPGDNIDLMCMPGPFTTAAAAAAPAAAAAAAPVTPAGAAFPAVPPPTIALAVNGAGACARSAAAARCSGCPPLSRAATKVHSKQHNIYRG